MKCCVLQGGILNLSRRDKELAQDLMSSGSIPGLDRDSDTEDDEREPLIKHRRTIN